MKSYLVIGVVLSLFSLSLTRPAAPVRGRATLLVQLQPATMAAERTQLFQSLEAEVVGEIPQLDLLCISVPAAGVDTALAELNQEKVVNYAEPNALAQATLWPNDAGWVEQWGPQKIGAPLAWDTTTGSPDLVIAVLDSGVTLDHPDLSNQLWVNPGEVPGNGTDDDSNGKVDDIWGWRFYHDWDGQTYVPMEDNRVADDYGHGTHVAGIAGAEIDNGIGVAGMAGGSRLMTVKVLDQYGTGWYFDIAQGIVYAVQNGARIINLSLGGKASSQTLQNAVDYAQAHGVLVVAAAGNDGGVVLYPAACDGALGVTATDSDDQRPSFSNHGPQVDVAAPGVDIYSTWPWVDAYWTTSGTSTAAPHVAGIAALIRSLQPALTPVQVTHVITMTAHDVHAPGWDPYTGWGRVDAETAILPLVKPLVTLSKAAVPLRQSPGAPVTYTITFGNDGYTATGIIVSDTLPSEVEFTSARPPATYHSATHELVWGPLTLTRGARVAATVAVTLSKGVTPCTSITNSVYLFYSGMDQPLAAEATHHVRPCYVYLPIITKNGTAGTELRPQGLP